LDTQNLEIIFRLDYGIDLGRSPLDIYQGSTSNRKFRLAISAVGDKVSFYSEQKIDGTTKSAYLIRNKVVTMTEEYVWVKITYNAATGEWILFKGSETENNENIWTETADHTGTINQYFNKIDPNEPLIFYNYNRWTDSYRCNAIHLPSLTIKTDKTIWFDGSIR
jgi:hypothetical protein